LSLSIQKSTAKNHIATYLEIGNQHYSAANLEISSKTISLPIHKSVAKTFSLPISKSAAMMESFQLYFSFFFVFLVFTITLHILPFYFHTTLHSFMLNPFIIMNMSFYLSSCMFPWVKQGHKFQFLSFHFILFHYLPWPTLSLGFVHHVHPFLFCQRFWNRSPHLTLILLNLFI
jgi:hypothetical protein